MKISRIYFSYSNIFDERSFFDTPAIFQPKQYTAGSSPFQF